MSSLDLRSSFWQIPLEEESKKYTAFMFEGKVYEFNVVPFGLKVSLAALIRGLDHITRGLGVNFLNFVDDWLIVSKEESQHLQHLEDLFKRLVKYNFTLNLDKSQFLRQSISFLGYILTTDGIRPDDKKVDHIKNFPRPKNVRELQSFLGTVNFYSKFAQKYAEVLVPLFDLLKTKNKWEWGDREIQAFQKAKSLFINDVVLSRPDTQKPYILRTDASEFAIGSVLSQIDDEGYERVIIFISRVLHPGEIAYFTTEKELLAIVWSLEKLETYLKAAKIYIKTDHKALSFMLKSRFTCARIRRWVMAIQDYDINIEYVSGKDNIVPDLLSRHPDYYPYARIKPGEIVIAAMQKMKLSSELNQLLKRLKELQMDDEFCIKCTNKHKMIED